MDAPPQLAPEVIIQLKAKDSTAFAMVYDCYAPPLYGLIYRIIKDEQLAQDALQDTFVKVWQNIDQWDRSKSQLFTWMFAIARNTALDRVRQLSKARVVPMEGGKQVACDTDNHVALEQIELLDMLDHLEPKYSEVIRYLYLKGWSQRDMAKHTGIPLGTIKSRVSKALELLKGRYNSKKIASLLSLLIMMCNG